MRQLSTPIFRLLSLMLSPLIFYNGSAVAETVLEVREGKAAWYGKKFDGRKTASGEVFNSDHPVGAHPSWPFGTIVRVTNKANNRALKVRIIDRGPIKSVQQRGIIVDLSLGSAKVLGYVKQGLADVKLEVLQWGEKK